MRIEFDPDKSALNTEERGLPFTSVDLLDWETARIVEDVASHIRNGDSSRLPCWTVDCTSCALRRSKLGSGDQLPQSQQARGQAI